MADPFRVKSSLPLGINISEPHPDPDHPGNSPALKSFVLRPGVNDLGEADTATFKAWAGASGQGFVASPDDVKAGLTDGKVYEMAEDEPTMEFGQEPALKRAVEAMSGEPSSTVTDPGPVPADAMRTAPAVSTVAPAVLTASAPLKTPVTSDAGGVVPAAKVQPAPAAK